MPISKASLTDFDSILWEKLVYPFCISICQKKGCKDKEDSLSSGCLPDNVTLSYPLLQVKTKKRSSFVSLVLVLPEAPSVKLQHSKPQTVSRVIL